MENIIKTFQAGVTQFQLTDAIEQNGYVVTKPGCDRAQITLPSVCPTLAHAFFGFDICGYELEVAIKGKEFYFVANWDSTWRASPTPEFQTVEKVRSAISNWSGPIQFLIRLSKNSWFKSLKIGYQVVRNLNEYLLEIALPEKLKIPVLFERSAIVSDDGWGVELPLGFDPKTLENIFIKPYDGPKIPAEYAEKLNRIELSQKLMPDMGVQVIFSHVPEISWIRNRTMSQSSSLPFVELRLIEEINVRQPMWEQGLSGGFTDAPEKVRDLKIRFRCVAYTDGDVGNISMQLRDFVSQNGSLYLPPFDLTFGMQADRRTTQDLESFSVIQNLPSNTFDVLIKNV